MRTILVPFDFSDEATHALNFAQQLAIKAKCKLQVGHIAEVPTPQSFSTKGEMNLHATPVNQIYIIELVEKRNRHLQELEEKHQEQPYHVKTGMTFGNPY